MTPKPRSIVEHLDCCTVRIETDDGGVGTGFFYAVPKDGDALGEGKEFAPFVITNRHVINGVRALKMTLTMKDGKGKEQLVHTETLLGHLQPTLHPQGVDLAALNLMPILAAYQQQGLTWAGTWLDKSISPSPNQLKGLGPLSDIVMVGYPSGVWDEVHNKPVFRRGVTATHPAIAWNGAREFLIDTATFGGSSGSPVFAYNIGGFQEGDNYVMAGQRLLLIGVARGVMVHTLEGEVEVVDIPTHQKAVSLVGVPNNLGICVAIGALEALIREALRPRLVPGWSMRYG